MATVEELVARSKAAQKQFEFATQEQADAVIAGTGADVTAAEMAGEAAAADAVAEVAVEAAADVAEGAGAEVVADVVADAE